MITVGEIEQRLRSRVEELARQLLPNARREGKMLVVGSINGEPGQSMVINFAGDHQGRWKDFASGEGGDMLDLIAACEHLPEKRDAVAWAKRWLGIEDNWQRGTKGPTQEERRARSEAARQLLAYQQAKEALARESRIRGAKALYLKGEPIDGTPGEHYLRGRGLEPAACGGRAATWPGALRYHSEIWCKAAGVKVPAMLAPIYLADGRQVATHRTFLMRDSRGWTKLDIARPKTVLGPLGGGFVPINKGASGKPMSRMLEGEPVYVTEGIEDAIVVRMKKPDARVICSVSLANLGAIVLPEVARRLIVVCDRDENEQAQEQLERSIARHQARGLEVGIVMPPPGIKDLNDWLLELKRGAA
jgi:Toprim domain